MTVDIYVDPDATGDADGTSWTHAYTGLATAEAALPGTAITEPYIIHCRSGSGSVDSSIPAFNTGGYAPSATNTLTIVSDDNHGGYYNSSAYRIENENYPVIDAQSDYTTFDGLQIRSVKHNGTRPSMAIGGVDVHVKNCIMYKTAGGSSNGGCYTYSTSNSFQIQNCLIDIYGTASYGIAQSKNGSCIVHCYGNTLVNLTGTAIDNGGGGTDKVIARNNLIYNCTTATSGSFGADTDYNATDNSSMGYTVTGAPGGEPTNDQTSATFTFVDAAGDDYNLASGDSGAKDLGTNTASSPLYALSSTDAKGDARGGTWDIGMSEYVSAGGANSPTGNISGPLGGPFRGVI